METYVILRRGGWRTADELAAAAERSTTEGERMPDDVALDPQLRARGARRLGRDGLHLPGDEPRGDSPPRQRPRTCPSTRSSRSPTQWLSGRIPRGWAAGVEVTARSEWRARCGCRGRGSSGRQELGASHCSSRARSRTAAGRRTAHPGAAATANVVVRWNEALLQGVRDSKLGPPMVARALAIAHTCAYDAWAAYDRLAVGTRLGGALRRPARERRSRTRSRRSATRPTGPPSICFPAARSSVFDPLMAEPRARSRRQLVDGHPRPAGIGNVAGRRGARRSATATAPTNSATSRAAGRRAVLRLHGLHARRTTPMDTRLPFDPTTVHDPNRWQPLTLRRRSGQPRHALVHRRPVAARAPVRDRTRAIAALSRPARPGTARPTSSRRRSS